MASRTVLLLDDDAAFRSAVREPLEARDIEVVEAIKGRDAYRLIDEVEPSALIVDGLLPDTNGVKWLETVRRGGIDVPAIFVSAFYRDLDSYKKLKALGVDSVLHKPLDPEELAKKVADLFDARGEIREESIPIIDVDLLEAAGDVSSGNHEPLKLEAAGDVSSGRHEPLKLEPEPLRLDIEEEESLTQVDEDVGYEPPGSSSMPPANEDAVVDEVTADMPPLPPLEDLPRPGDAPTSIDLAEPFDWEPKTTPVPPERVLGLPDASTSSAGALRALPPRDLDGSMAIRRSAIPAPSDDSRAAAARVRETSLRSRSSRLLGPRLLVVERDPAVVDYVAGALADTLVQIEVARELGEASELATRVDAALLGVSTADQATGDAPEVALAQLRADAPELPIGFFALEESDALRYRAAASGADLYVAHPLGALELERAVFRLEARGEGRPLRMVALADGGGADEVGDALAQRGVAVQRYEALSNVLRGLGRERPHLVLLGHEDAVQTIRLLRMADGGDDVALVVVRPDASRTDWDPCMAAGADDVISTGADAAERALARARTIRERRRQAVDA
ncbi:MAG: response regulator, partial [Myxococcota bacterium]